jgi:hypothetical protein
MIEGLLKSGCTIDIQNTMSTTNYDGTLAKAAMLVDI